MRICVYICVYVYIKHDTLWNHEIERLPSSPPPSSPSRWGSIWMVSKLFVHFYARCIYVYINTTCDETHEIEGPASPHTPLLISVGECFNGFITFRTFLCTGMCIWMYICVYLHICVYVCVVAGLCLFYYNYKHMCVVCNWCNGGKCLCQTPTRSGCEVRRGSGCFQGVLWCSVQCMQGCQLVYKLWLLSWAFILLRKNYKRFNVGWCNLKPLLGEWYVLHRGPPSSRWQGWVVRLSTVRPSFCPDVHGWRRPDYLASLASVP